MLERHIKVCSHHMTWSRSCLKILQRNYKEYKVINKWNVKKLGLFPGGTSGKEHTCQCRRYKRQETQVWSLGQEDPLEEEVATHSSILAWRIHGQRSLAGYSPWGCKESDMTEWLSTQAKIWIQKIYEGLSLGTTPRRKRGKQERTEFRETELRCSCKADFNQLHKCSALGRPFRGVLSWGGRD